VEKHSSYPLVPLAYPGKSGFASNALIFVGEEDRSSWPNGAKAHAEGQLATEVIPMKVGLMKKQKTTRIAIALHSENLDKIQ